MQNENSPANPEVEPVWVVTGATGLVGETLLTALWEFYQGQSVPKQPKLRASYRKASRIGCQGVLPSQLKPSNNPECPVDWQACNLQAWNDLNDLIEGAEMVFHCAALVSYDPRDASLLFENNSRLTGRLVDACLRSGVRRLIYISSIAALGPSRNGEIIHENTPWDDKGASSVYGRSKFAAELEVWRGQEEGLEVIVVNPSVILGPGSCEEGSNQMFRQVDQGLLFYPPGSLGVVDVRDVARACIALNQNHTLGRRFLLNGANLSFKELFGEIARTMGKRSPVFSPPYLLARLGAFIQQLIKQWTGGRNYLSSETVKAAYTRKHYDGSAITRALPGFVYTPWHQTVRDGIRHYQATTRPKP
ncbi:MAG: NAD-dependent epimerase/dehydratase family protein [Bacteroidia bacterium]